MVEILEAVEGVGAETGISRRIVSNAAAKGKIVNECQCTMSSWKSQCVRISMLLADTLLGHRNGCCGPGALPEQSPPNEAECVG